MTNGRERIKQALDGAAFQRKPLNVHDAAINMQLMLDVCNVAADALVIGKDDQRLDDALAKLDRLAV